MSLTDNIEHSAGTLTLSFSGGCAGVGATVIRGDSSSGNHPIIAHLKGTVCTGGCPPVGIVSVRISSSCPGCCAGDIHWTRGCPVLIGTQSGARRRSVGNLYADTDWREKAKWTLISTGCFTWNGISTGACG